MNLEFEVIEETKLVLQKEELEKWRDHYVTTSKQYREQWRRMFYLGKAEVLTDMLKHYDELVG